MPTDHRIRLYDEKDLFPSRPEPEQYNPEGAIQWCEPGLRSRQGVRCELLAQGKLDDRRLLVTSKEAEDRVKEGDNECKGLNGKRDRGGREPNDSGAAGY